MERIWPSLMNVVPNSSSASRKCKALLFGGLSPDVTGRFHAGRIVKGLAAMVGGGGGGAADLAQAGGSRPEKLDAAIDQACEVIAAASSGS